MPERRDLRLLLVDDHPVMRAGVRALLTAEPDLKIVGEADDGAPAVKLVLDLRPDVVIMDISLPELGGAEATKQILAAVPETRVLVLSAHEETAVVRLLFGAGATGYVLKRSAGDELVRAVHVVAARQTYVDPAMAPALDAAPRSRRHSAKGLPAASLSEREAEVIRLIARGHTSKEMAEKLGISPRTLETYKSRAMAKLTLRSRAELIRYAMRSGWLRDV